MKDTIEGIHHITAVSGPAQENVNFYAGVLGLRFVKKTINFDDPGTYHLYYGDREGRPGSIMTFFPWAHARPGRTGAGMVGATAFSVPEGSLDFWISRLADAGMDRPILQERLKDNFITFQDPHGLDLELVESPDADSDAHVWKLADPAFAIRGFQGVALLVSDPDPTISLIRDIFKYEFVAEEGARMRFRSPTSSRGRIIDIVRTSEGARPGAGTTHHVAFRARDEQEQKLWRQAIADAGLFVTEVKDRSYFKSIYFREPNGVLFEIATDSPGFAIDEPVDRLGEQLMLPPWMESRRSDIEKRLEPLSAPHTVNAEAS